MAETEDYIEFSFKINLNESNYVDHQCFVQLQKLMSIQN